MRISDWSSDVCSSDLPTQAAPVNYTVFWRMFHLVNPPDLPISLLLADDSAVWRIVRTQLAGIGAMKSNLCVVFTMATALSLAACDGKPEKRSEEHTSELQSLMRISYAVFCLKKKKRTIQSNAITTHT